MVNLLNETIETLKDNGKTENDVIYCCGNDIKFTWENFKKIADVVYDDGYGGAEVARDLKIVGNDFWLERGEYDGSEWWEFKEYPNCDGLDFVEIKAATRDQADDIRDKVGAESYYGCYSGLFEMNNV